VLWALMLVPALTLSILISAVQVGIYYWRHHEVRRPHGEMARRAQLGSRRACAVLVARPHPPCCVQLAKAALPGAIPIVADNHLHASKPACYILHEHSPLST
jgi:hypothetical protein